MFLEPHIGNVFDEDDFLPDVPPSSMIAALHNEQYDAQSYPLRLEKGLYFSEVVGTSNRTAQEYRRLIRQSVELLRARLNCAGELAFNDLIEAGKDLQDLDAEFAERHVDSPLDSLHSLAGPDRTHPYAKLTVARTAFSVRFATGPRHMFFEKFLVCYSYCGNRGDLQPTVTPIHSHPLNFETVYFLEGDERSKVVEQEFILDYKGEELVAPDGSLHSEFLQDALNGRVRLGIRPGPCTEYDATQRVRKLSPFGSETSFMRAPELLGALDGYFRPHRVTVGGDKTRYFALDNYFSMTGRVLLYEGADEVVWQHNAWVPR